MIQHYIVNPCNGDLISLQDWKKFVGENDSVKIDDAQYICIVPDDGTPFVLYKKSLGRMEHKEGEKAVAQFRFAGLAGHEDDVPTMPSRAQATWIGDCNYALEIEPDIKLQDSLDAIGGDDICVLCWTAQRYSVGGAWSFGGSGGDLGSNLVVIAIQVQAVAHYPEAAERIRKY